MRPRRDPKSAYDLPVYSEPLVHRDHHVEVAKALYSVPGTSSGSAYRPGPTATWSGSTIGDDW